MFEGINNGLKLLMITGLATALFLPGRQTVAFTGALFKGFSQAEGTAIRG